VLLLVLCILNNRKIGKLQEKYDFFIGKGEPRQIEELLVEHIQKVHEVAASQSQMMDRCNSIEKNLQQCIQKTGIIRYNPFDEMGGDLCFAIALLDDQDNGIVLNGIYSREGSYTYAKAIEAGKSKYTLSAEEVQALDMAKRTAYHKASERK
jgi:hypothetical protein